MVDTPAPVNLDFEEQRARIRRALDEADKLAAERLKLGAERDKLAAEALKLERDRMLAPWQIVMSSMAAGAALFGAGAAFIKLLGS
ncbi:hypothetical protein Q8W71_09240 [Methylobacterium sp. NEAU 140]|uniref:hypothetical protein n=1 Tax=Methylobacterium sp. NEAU 140 TaxID=3064945 RepID=UPI0027369ADF|nr:hypothetical protein [Methylobacterium sp. NEAU 140]MDP4022804.1 hypothetical protein [Methylobacterium sp. NEAU 140]